MENCLLRGQYGWRMLAKCSLVVDMFVLKDDANLSRRAVATVLWSMSRPAPFLWHHLEICPKIPVFLEECPVPLTSLLPAFAISGARQCLCPAAWDQAATSSSGKEGKLTDVTPERGCSTGLLLKITESSPWAIPSHSLAILLTLLVVLLCLGSEHAWVQQVENFIRNVDCLQYNSQIAT